MPSPSHLNLTNLTRESSDVSSARRAKSSVTAPSPPARGARGITGPASISRGRNRAAASASAWSSRPRSTALTLCCRAWDGASKSTSPTITWPLRSPRAYRQLLPTTFPLPVTAIIRMAQDLALWERRGALRRRDQVLLPPSGMQMAPTSIQTAECHQTHP